MPRAVWISAAVAGMLAMGCGDDGPDSLAGFVCGDTACPPGWYCEPPDGPCEDCGGPDCLALDDNVCSASSDCPLDAYDCVDGHCAPTRTCGADADCDADRFCWGVRENAPRYEPGVCLMREPSCTGPVTCVAGTCRVCVWGQWVCVAAGVYPDDVCVR